MQLLQPLVASLQTVFQEVEKGGRVSFAALVDIIAYLFKGGCNRTQIFGTVEAGFREVIEKALQTVRQSRQGKIETKVEFQLELRQYLDS